MRTKKVTRYYCGHCSKGMFRKPDMVRHESGCTKNPARVCYICGNNGDSSQEDCASLAAVLKAENNGEENMTIGDDDMRRVRAVACGCPSCILSILRLSDLFAWEKFDYKAELAEWHKAETIEKYGSLTRDF